MEVKVIITAAAGVNDRVELVTSRQPFLPSNMLTLLVILTTFMLSSSGSGKIDKALISLGWKRVMVVAQQHGTLMQAQELAKSGTHVAVGECVSRGIPDLDGIGEHS